MIRIYSVIMLWFFSTGGLLGHAGKDHDAPTSIKAPKGGIIKALDESRVEVLTKGKSIKIYLYDRAMKPVSPLDFKIAAKAEHPRTKKIEDINLEPKETYFDGSYDAKGVHRYMLKLEVTHAKTGQTDRLTFNVEPRK